MQMTVRTAFFSMMLCCFTTSLQRCIKAELPEVKDISDAVDRYAYQAGNALGNDTYASFLTSTTSRDLLYASSAFRAELKHNTSLNPKSDWITRINTGTPKSRRLARSTVKGADLAANVTSGSSGRRKLGPAGSEGARALSQAAAAKGNHKLNVLMVVLDDLRPDLAAWGHSNAPTTPHFDAFAHRARVFRRAYAQFPDCAPSRQSFLTGLRPDSLRIVSHDCTNKVHEGVECDFRKSRPGTVSMPEFFRKAGYLALSYGKVFHQGLDDEPSWSSQSEWPDGIVRGPAADTWAKRRWNYEQWFAPSHAVCRPAARATWHRNKVSTSPHNDTAVEPLAAAACFTEEHNGEAPLKDYIDHKTASYAAEAIYLLGVRPDGRPPQATAFAAATAAASAVKSKTAGLETNTESDVAAWRAGASAFAAAHERLKVDYEKNNSPLPWFLAVGFVRPHLPMVCPKRFWDNASDPHSVADTTTISPVLGGGSSFALKQITQSTESGFGEFRNYLPWSLRSISAFAAGRPGYETMSATYNDTGVDRKVADLRSDTRRAYRACVSFVDYEFGRVMTALSDSGQAEDTVVAVLSDHGWKLGEYNLWGKHSILHTDVHVPLMVRHPSMQAPGTPSQSVVELVDLFPTLVDLAMGPLPHQAEGRTSQQNSSKPDRRPGMPENLDGMSLAGMVAGNPATYTETELLPPNAKMVAKSQYMPFFAKQRCMAYTVIGKVRLTLPLFL
jgi:arylsulfatase A-like enzyme